MPAKRVRKAAKPKVYLETTVISYLTAWPSRDLVRVAHQQITREWWDEERARYEVFVSRLVVEEASAGDMTAAKDRLAALEELDELEIADNVTELAQKLVDEVPLPERAQADSVHIAVAVVNGMDYLLTWNCRHIANAALRRGIEQVCLGAGYRAPIICTPEELLEYES